MICRAYLILFLLIAVYKAPISAQENTLQNWTPIIINGALDQQKSWQYLLEVQPRTQVNHSIREDRFLLQGAIGYSPDRDKHWTLWQGGGYTPTFQPKYSNEVRTWQQVTYQNNLRGLNFRLQTRLEERLIGRNADLALRGRQAIRLSHPLPGSNNLSAVVSDEVLFNLNDAAGLKNGFDQNWLFIGLNRKLNEHLSIETGYLMDYINKPSARDKINHAMLTAFIIHL